MLVFGANWIRIESKIKVPQLHFSGFDSVVRMTSKSFSTEIVGRNSQLILAIIANTVWVRFSTGKKAVWYAVNTWRSYCDLNSLEWDRKFDFVILHHNNDQRHASEFACQCFAREFRGSTSTRAFRAEGGGHFFDNASFHVWVLLND